MAQDRRVTRTKNALTRALFELLEEKEFDKITVTELTRRADVDRKTFYLHFQTVGDILEEFYEVHMAKLQAALERGRGQMGMDVPGFFRSLNEIMDENLELYRHLARGPARDYFRDRLGEALKKRILLALEQETLGSAAELEIYAEFYTAGILAIYLRWLTGSLTVESEIRVAEITSRVILRGMGELPPAP